MQNPILAALKLMVFTAFTVTLCYVLIQYHSVEEKVLRTHDQVSTLDTTVSELKRSVQAARDDIRDARDAARTTSEHVDTLVQLAGQGLIGGGTNGSGPQPGSTSTAKTGSVRKRADRSSAPSVIAGVELYPYNPGWTVLCDAKANADPKRDLPSPEQIDWDAVLNDYTAGEPKGLNFYSDDRTSTVAALSFYCLDALATRKTSEYQEWNAALAERIEESPDRRVYTIYLRQGVRWHDPEPAMLRKYPWLKGAHFVTARDVKFTYDLLRNENTSTPLKVYYEDIEDVELLDEYTVRVTWKEPNFYARASTMDIQPIPAHIWGSDPDGNPYGEPAVYTQFGKHWFGKSMCGNGPYRFVQYKLSDYFHYVRNESYYGQRATCKGYYVHIIRDNTARLARFWAGDLVFMILGAEQYRTFVLEGDEDKPLHRYERFNRPAPKDWEHTYFIWRRPTYGGFGWNQRKPLFSDRRVRRALTLALNRYAVPEKIFYGLGEVIPIGESVLSHYYNKNIKPLPFDLDRAKALMTEAGWTDTDGDGILDKVINGQKKDFEFKLLIASSSAEQLSICQMYKEDLLKIGMKLTPDPAESALWSRNIHDRNFDGFIIFWTAGFDSNPRQLWDSTKVDDTASNNYTGYGDPEADKIFEELTTTFDYPARIKRMHRWFEMQFRDQPYTWIWALHSPIIGHADWRIPEPSLISPKIDRRLIFKWKKRS